MSNENRTKYDLTTIDGKPYFVKRDEKNELVGVETNIEKLISMMGSQFKTEFNQIRICQGKTYLYRSSSEDMIEFDAFDDDLVKNKLNFPDTLINKIRSQIEYSHKNPVPDEFQNKYCLLFGGQVAYSADSLEEIDKYASENNTIDFTRYIPQSTS